MKRLAVPLLVVISMSGWTLAEAGDAGQPAGSISQRVDKLFEKWDKTVSPGCALAVMKDGRIVHQRGYGMADLDHNVPISPSTVFHVASMSKQFTAAAILLLSQEGKLSLDDPVRKYVSELPDFGTAITIRQLVHHTSGLRDQWDMLGFAGWRYSLDLITDDDVLSVFSRQKNLNFTPGSRHLYCNTGYTLLAQIVKRVSGQSFRQFTTTRIFEPLGMKSTHFRDDHAEIVKNSALGYEPAGDTFKISITNFDTVGATSLLTTVEDLAYWDENFYQPRVGGAAMVRQMLQKGRLNDGTELDYAFGLGLGQHRGLATVDHGGGDAGYRSDLIRFPDQHLSVACLCNLAAVNPGDLTRNVAALYLADEMAAAERKEEKAKSAAVNLSEDQLKSKAGLYLNSDGDQPRKIIVQDGTLRVIPGLEGESYELEPSDANHFRLKVAPIDFQFETQATGEKLHLIESSGREKPGVFERIAQYSPSTDELQQYVGAYYSLEIDPVYQIKLEDGKLVNHRLKFEPETLRPMVRDVFAGRDASFRFARNSKGQVTGFAINSGRVRNLRFERGSSKQQIVQKQSNEQRQLP